MTRPEARSGAIGCAAVKRNTDQGDFEFRGLGDVGQTQEGRNPSEAGVGQGVQGLGMRQPEVAAGLSGGVAHGEAS